jgi:hypothetical protein
VICTPVFVLVCDLHSCLPKASFFQEATAKVLNSKLCVCENVVAAKFAFDIEGAGQSKRRQREIVRKAFEILLNPDDKYALRKGIPLTLQLMNDRLISTHFVFQQMFNAACESQVLEELDLTHVNLTGKMPHALRSLLPKLKFYKLSEGTQFEDIPRGSVIGDLIYNHSNLRDQKKLKFDREQVGYGGRGLRRAVYATLL